MANTPIREASQEAAKRIFEEVRRSGASPLSRKQFSKIIEEEVGSAVKNAEPPLRKKMKPH